LDEPTVNNLTERMGSVVSCLGEQAAKLKHKIDNKKGEKEKRGECCGIEKPKLMTDWLVI